MRERGPYRLEMEDRMGLRAAARRLRYIFAQAKLIMQAPALPNWVILLFN